SLELDASEANPGRTNIIFDTSDCRRHNITFRLSLRRRQYPYPVDPAGYYTLNFYQRGVMFASQHLEEADRALEFKASPTAFGRAGDIQAMLVCSTGREEAAFCGGFLFTVEDFEKRGRPERRPQAPAPQEEGAAKAADIEEICVALGRIIWDMDRKFKALDAKLDRIQESITKIGVYWQ
ncbi:MAG: hypothetical protein LBT59_27890, partial [Clostridiales bacterium]|nr:hypothetical protein [Clostridiales bacterium]